MTSDERAAFGCICAHPNDISAHFVALPLCIHMQPDKWNPMHWRVDELEMRLDASSPSNVLRNAEKCIRAEMRQNARDTNAMSMCFHALGSHECKYAFHKCIHLCMQENAPKNALNAGIKCSKMRIKKLHAFCKKTTPHAEHKEHITSIYHPP